MMPRLNMLLTVVVLVVLSACENNKKVRQPTDAGVMQADQELPTRFIVFSNDTLTDTALNGYGFQLFWNDKLYVHQPNIPAIQGNKGFMNPEDAGKVAALMAYKVNNQILPPSITIAELDSLKISY